jgi:hypothetical protein
MSVADSYSDAVSYRARVGKSDSASDGAILDDLIAISRYLDRELDRFFTQDAAAVTRVVYPRGYHGGDPEAENPWRGVRGARLLDLDADLAVRPTSVIIDLNRTGSFSGYAALAQPDASGVSGGDYQLWPLNVDKGPEPKPWTQLYIPTWSGQFGFPPGCPVQVTAIWGWPAVPRAIARATEQLTAILRLESPRATQRIPEGIAAAVGESLEGQRIVAQLAQAYKRQRIFA